MNYLPRENEFVIMHIVLPKYNIDFWIEGKYEGRDWREKLGKLYFNRDVVDWIPKPRRREK